MGVVTARKRRGVGGAVVNSRNAGNPDASTGLPPIA